MSAEEERRRPTPAAWATWRIAAASFDASSPALAPRPIAVVALRLRADGGGDGAVAVRPDTSDSTKLPARGECAGGSVDARRASTASTASGAHSPGDAPSADARRSAVR